ncbi:hypothetical protein [Magnetospirillum sp. 64-120]|uniref:hypothetical protein n=1 Tax=Magnetospirillum sp. 64-120 TaxID=1895778 RepID=UPI0025C4D42F|nr:hypothetical protein [Magnetospirillum sp. 64-120]
MPRSPNPTGAVRWGLVAIAALALAVGALAAPRLVAGTLFALAPNVRENPFLTRDGDEEESVRRLEQSQRWSRWGDAGAAQAKAADLAKRADTRSMLEATLAGSPLRPDLWLKLAQDRLAAAPDQALAAWRLSVFTSRVYPPVMAPRLDLGLRLKQRMDDADLDLLRDQMRLTFVLMPAHTTYVLAKPENAPHRQFYQSVVNALSPTDIDHMVRIHALH